MKAFFDAVAQKVAGLSIEDQMGVVADEVKGLPKAQQKLLAEAVDAGLPPPDQPTSNVVWLAVVGTFLATMLIAVVVLCVGTFTTTVGVTKPDTILTVFTTTSAFLAGLFVSRPQNPARRG